MPENKRLDEDKIPKVNIHIGGNVGRDVNIADGDLTINNSVNSQNAQTLNPFDVVRQTLAQLELSPLDLEDASLAIDKIETLDKEDKADNATLDRWLDLLEKIAPTLIETLITAATNPVAAISKGAVSTIKAWRKLS